MNASHEYSLWLMPTGEIYGALSQEIANLARQYGTPTFEPHVTLASAKLGPLDEALERTHQLASSLRNLHLRTGHPAFETAYFRSLYLKVRRSVSLIRAYYEALDLFALPYVEYKPHLSLLYSDLSLSAKKEIIERLVPIHPVVFEANAIYIVDTNTTVADWHEVGRIPID